MISRRFSMPSTLVRHPPSPTSRGILPPSAAWRRTRISDSKRLSESSVSRCFPPPSARGPHQCSSASRWSLLTSTRDRDELGLAFRRLAPPRTPENRPKPNSYSPISVKTRITSRNSGSTSYHNNIFASAVSDPISPTSPGLSSSSVEHDES